VRLLNTVAKGYLHVETNSGNVVVHLAVYLWSTGNRCHEIQHTLSLLERDVCWIVLRALRIRTSDGAPQQCFRVRFSEGAAGEWIVFRYAIKIGQLDFNSL
jgi:hypothetical protein